MSRAVVAAGLVCLAGISVSALQPPQFRTGVDLVHLDVSVLDRDRRPVRGLTAADFTILEDGVPQELSVFTAVEIDDPDPPAVEWMREVAPDVRTNEGIDERRLFLIIIDDAMIQADVAALASTREIGHKVIDRLGPSDLGAVVFTRDNRNSQDYTADRAALRAAVGKFTVGFRDMGSDDFLYRVYSARAIERAVETLTSLPDRRKSVIYIGQGLPVSLAQESQIRHSIMEAFRHARLANVNVYPVDVCGLRVERLSPPPPPKTCQPGPEVEYLQVMAANTQARAIINTNDFDPGVQAIFDENASYYLLGFRSSAPRDGRFRRIDVRVNRPGVEVRARNGYRTERERDAARRRAAIAKTPLDVALSGVLPKSDLPLDVTAVAVPLPGRRESAVSIVVGVRQPVRATAERTTERVDLRVSAFNTDGRAFGSVRRRADIAIRPNATGQGEYELLARLDLRPGRYQLRVAAHVASLAMSGSLYYDVEVPDVTRAPVSLTPIVLSASPGPVVAPRDALAGILPVVPTARRSFTAAHTVEAFTRVHQGGRDALVPVPLRVRLEDHNGRTVMDRALDMAADAFTPARAADARIEIPVSELDPGAYLLTVETASAETPLRRVIRFQLSELLSRSR
jgi:VWFA-related protein